MEEIVNKVAGSGIESIDLADLRDPCERRIFDIKPHLFMGQILKEKEFREFVKTNEWSVYQGKIAGITCSADAIVPTWAFMLVAIALEPFAQRIYFADGLQLEELLFAEKIAGLDLSPYKDKRVVIKGCGDEPVPVNAFVMLSARLKPFVKSIMYGEPCSTVPLYKAPKK